MSSNVSTRAGGEAGGGGGGGRGGCSFAVMTDVIFYNCKVRAMAGAVIELTGAVASFKVVVKTGMMAEQYINDISQP